MGNKLIPLLESQKMPWHIISYILWAYDIEPAREKPFQTIIIHIQYANHIAGYEQFGSPFQVVPHTRDSDVACREDENTQRSIIDSFLEWW